MRIAILTLGTRGDMQPYIALALGLRAAGHDVVISGPENFTDWVQGFGFDYVSGGLDLQALLQTPEGRDLISGSLWAIIRNFRDLSTKITEEIIDGGTQASDGADLIIYHPKVPVAADLGEAKNIPVIQTALQPVIVPTGDFAIAGLGNGRLGRRINRWTYGAIRAQRAMFSKQLNRWRTDVLGLRPLPRFAKSGEINGEPLPVLHAFSKHVVRRPEDWPDHAFLTGYWFLDDTTGWTPPPDLQAFLDAGPPPVYVGFGSMTDKDPEAKAQLVIEAVAKADCRAVIATGWGGLTADALPNTIFAIDGAPHDKLFPLMSAIVHHGGAGTTAAAFKAGRPQLVVPYFGDQPFWGHRVADLNVGLPPIPQKKLTSDKLAHALRGIVKDKSFASHAETVAHDLAKEDGVATAVSLIERLAGAHSSV
jgi:sterol 3beta-glucosyltransferase